MFITNETEEIETLEKEKERQLQYTIGRHRFVFLPLIEAGIFAMRCWVVVHKRERSVGPVSRPQHNSYDHAAVTYWYLWVWSPSKTRDQCSLPHWPFGCGVHRLFDLSGSERACTYTHVHTKTHQAFMHTYTNVSTCTTIHTCLRKKMFSPGSVFSDGFS